MPESAVTFALGDEIARREQLYAFLDNLRRGDLALGVSDFARLDRVLVLLRARGIGWDEPSAAKWFAPVLCGAPTEQAFFHERFREFISKRNDSKTKSPGDLAVAGLEESTHEEQPVLK